VIQDNPEGLMRQKNYANFDEITAYSEDRASVETGKFGKIVTINGFRSLKRGGACPGLT
jgi:hypothetical protein